MANKDWDKALLVNTTEYVHYNGQFVARFKYRPRGLKPSFMKFLKANFTPAEYFGLRAQNKTPVDILESKGWIAPHVKEMVEKAGFPGTPEGRNAFIKQRVNKILAS